MKYILSSLIALALAGCAETPNVPIVSARTGVALTSSTLPTVVQPTKNIP